MGYLRFVYAVLALLIGWMLGHRRGFDRGIAHAGRLVHAHGGKVATSGVPVAGETAIRGGGTVKITHNEILMPEPGLGPVSVPRPMRGLNQ